MKILAIIPARGGSKRLPEKNIKLLGGKPLINWTIESTLGIPQICHTLVSTDNTAISQIAVSAGAYVPWLRPDLLATDEATTISVALHSLDWYENNHEEVDGLLLLQPTSPFRTRKSIEAGIAIFEKNGGTPVIAVSTAQDHPMWTLKQDGNYLTPFLGEKGFASRSQDLESVFVVNGSFYLSSPEDLRQNNSFFGPKISGLLIDSPLEAIDIDTPWDFKLAETLYQIELE